MAIRRARLLRLRLSCDPSAPAHAREALARLPVIEPVRDDALLVASELVTNAVLHSGCNSREDLEVVADASPDSLIIAVTDVGRSETVPRPRPSAERPGGLGLRVVAALARSWGTDRRSGRRVWAELAL